MPTEVASQSAPAEEQHDIEKSGIAKETLTPGDETLKPEGLEDPNKQDGIKQVQALTAVWSKKALWSTFILIWLVCFVMAMISNIQYALAPYITSSFSQHGLLSTINIASRVIAGVAVLAIAKLIDIRGRLEGFVGAIFLIIIGMIIKAVSQNVETYAAGEVFFWLGQSAVNFTLDVFVADITTLRNRMIIFTLNSTPFIITTFAGPPIAELFYYKSHFRWAFGSFCFILAGFSLPVIGIMWFYQRKAEKLGLIREKSGRTTAESLRHYFVQFDVVGMVLISAGFTMLTLPFSLVTLAGGWQSPTIICLIIFGFVLLVLFGIWERYFATVMFFPFELLRDRTILGASLTYFGIFLSTFIWNAYYGSYLQVVHNLSITVANYVLNCYSLTSYFTGPFIALFIRHTGYVKYPAYIGIPIYVLGTALIVYFRHPDTNVGYLAMCQVLVGFGVELLQVMSHLALMAKAGPSNVAVAMAIYGLFGSIGASTSYAIAGGMWTNIFPYNLEAFLPDEYKGQAHEIYGDITKQMQFPIGHPVRDAVIAAYADVARKMVIVGACLIPLVIGAVAIWKNFNVKEMEGEEKQEKGNVF
ncbi:major facilitator superfamily transporter [Thozetella sp. PMI_491]|nr:major facilitator superfamily transporter [Thozetella sp. PMI_491]